MAKAGDETGAETTDTTRSKTRAVARTKTSEAKAKTNEGEVAETWKNDPLEITEEPLAKTTDTEAAETTGGNAGTKIGHVIRTENDEYNVAVQEIGTEQIEFEDLCHLLFSRYAPSDRHRSE